MLGSSVWTAISSARSLSWISVFSHRAYRAQASAVLRSTRRGTWRRSASRADVARGQGAQDTHAEVSWPASICESGEERSARRHKGSKADDVAGRRTKVLIWPMTSLSERRCAGERSLAMLDRTGASQNRQRPPAVQARAHDSRTKSDSLRLLRTSLPTRSFLPTETSLSATSTLSLSDSMTAFFFLSTRPCRASRHAASAPRWRGRSGRRRDVPCRCAPLSRARPPQRATGGWAASGCRTGAYLSVLLRHETALREGHAR